MSPFSIEWFALAIIALILGTVIGISMYRSGIKEGKAEATGNANGDRS